MRTLIRHILVPITALLLTVGLPYVNTDYYKAKKSGSTDAVTSASTAIDAPSGEYVVMINRDRHKNSSYLDIWQDFFEKGESEDIYTVFEDISCVCASGDSGGLDMAKSYRSRLAKNQMSIRQEDAVLMLSKAEYGRFDVIVMSKEFYDKNSAERIGDGCSVCVINAKSII